MSRDDGDTITSADFSRECHLDKYGLRTASREAYLEVNVLDNFCLFVIPTFTSAEHTPATVTLRTGP